MITIKSLTTQCLSVIHKHKIHPCQKCSKFFFKKVPRSSNAVCWIITVFGFPQHIPGQFTLPCSPELTGSGCTTHKLTERTQTFSYSVLARMVIRFYKPQDKSGKTSNSSRGAALLHSSTSKSLFIRQKVTQAGFLFRTQLIFQRVFCQHLIDMFSQYMHIYKFTYTHICSTI